MEVVVDSNAGFCSGVVAAIQAAENHLHSSERLYCLGDIVHNNEEVERLSAKGLEVITYERFAQLRDTKVLIRAHGEPPSTYQLAARNNIQLVDATCPIVLALQKKIRKGYEEMKNVGGQVVIFGKKGHAEVIGLNGQTDNTAIVISDMLDIEQIDFAKPMRIYSQTTQNKEQYEHLIETVKQRCASLANDNVLAFNTICGRVSNRIKELTDFAASVDIVVFVSGQNSSNGKYLYEHCKQVKDNTLLISGLSELKKESFVGVERIGITGATSTPRWLMEKVATWIDKNL
ncbi:MAG: 4-hydroxy-3-methylbut-2-enyl diphosphate reductase [Bacteroidales bacterium]|nr:4-hydroxy-3-methylbut-2-enyl diphosphate reductase [Bacteroidales bacterium]